MFSKNRTVYAVYYDLEGELQAQSFKLPGVTKKEIHKAMLEYLVMHGSGIPSDNIVKIFSELTK